MFGFFGAGGLRSLSPAVFVFVFVFVFKASGGRSWGTKPLEATSFKYLASN